MKLLVGLSAAMILALGAMLAPASGAHEADDEKLVCPYLPLKVGTTWEYASGPKKAVVKVKVAKHEKVDDLDCAVLESDDGTALVTEHLTVKADGVYRVRANNQKIQPHLCVLKLPAGQQPPKKGETWSIESNVQNFPLKGKFTLGEEKLKVGDKEYATINVKSSELTMADLAVTMETWYAKDVGMVKQHVKMPTYSLDVVLELTKFTTE